MTVVIKNFLLLLGAYLWCYVYDLKDKKHFPSVTTKQWKTDIMQAENRVKINYSNNFQTGVSSGLEVTVSLYLVK